MENLRSRKLRKIIKDYLGNRTPENEEDLQKIQAQIFKIINIQESTKNLHPLIRKNLEINLQKFKLDYFAYLYEVAKYFYRQDILTNQKFKDFAQRFAEHIKSYKRKGIITHVATLNYDRLLYKEFLKHKILVNSFKDTFLVDGFTDKLGFDKENLSKKYRNIFGWYIHLHGSPLYYTNLKESRIEKSKINDDLNFNKETRNHIILCDPKQKYEAIQHAILLRTYFDYFERAIEEADKIVIIGYGGDDVHVNEVIKKFAKKKGALLIITRDCEKEKVFLKWKKILEMEPNLKCYNCILDYKFSD